MRRFLKLAAILIPVLVLVAVVSLLLYLRSDGFRETLRQRVVQELEQRFALRAELDSIRVEWTGTAVRLEGLRLWDSQYPAPEPAIDLPAARVDFSIVSFVSPKATLDDLELDGLVVRVLEDPNDRLNLMNMFRREGGPPPDLGKLIGLGIRRWRLEGGLLIFRDQPLRLASSEGGLELNVRFYPERNRYAGVLQLSGVEFEAGALELSPMELEVKFELLPNSIELPSVIASTPALRAEQSGAILDLSDFRYTFDGRVVAQPALIDRPPLSREFSSGEFTARGTFSGTGGDFRYQGQLDSDAFQWRDFRFRDFSGRVRVDGESLVAEQTRFQFEGGRVQAEGELHWDEPGTSRFRLQGNGFQLARLAPFLQSPELQARGTARATAEVVWPGLDFGRLAGEGSASWTGDWVLPRPPLTPAVFPFEGAAGFQLAADGVGLQGGTLETLDCTVAFTGRVGLDGELNLDATLRAEQGGRLIEFASLSPVWPEALRPGPLPALEGVLAEVTVSSGAGPLVVAGNARAGQVSLEGRQLGSAAGDFRLESGQRFTLENFRLRGDPHSLEGGLEWALGTEDPGLRRLEADIQQARLEDWLALLEVDSPLRGRLSGDVRVSQRAPGDYQGSGRFRLREGNLLEQEITSLAGEYVVDGDQIRLSSLDGEVLGGTVAGDLLYSFPEGQFEVGLQGRGLQLGGLEMWPEGLPARGTADLTLQARGDTERFTLAADLRAPRLQLGEYRLDDLALSAHRRQPDDPELELALRTGFLGNPLLVSGRLGLEAPYPFRADMQLDELPLAPYLALLPAETRVQLAGETSGRARLAGRLSDFGLSEAHLELDTVRLVAEGYQVRNQTPLRVDYAGQVVRLAPVRFTGRETELEVSGSLDLRREPSVVVETKGTLNLLLLNPFLAGGSTLGSVKLETVVSGPLANPRIVGDAQVEDAFLQHPSLPTTLFETNGRLRFTANQIGIDQLSTRTPYGTLNAEGGVFLEGFEPVRWLVNVYGTGLRLEYPEQVFSTLDLDVDFLRNDNSQLLSGVVYVRSAEYEEEISLPELVLRYTGAPTFGPAVTGEEIFLDIEVEGYRTLQVDNNLANITASGDFTIRGTIDNPVVLGSLTVDEGTLYIEDNEYDVTRGTINFNNPRQTRPVFNFEAQTEVRDVSVNILVSGPVDQLKVTFRSDPPLPTSSIVSLLAVGQTQEEIFGSEGGQDQVGSLAIFGAGALLSKSLGQRLEAQSSRLFGFDRVSIDPFLFGSERNPGARVTLGKQLGNRLSVTYSTDLGSQTQGQIVVVELQITDWLTAVGTGEQDGTLALDFKLKKRF